MNNKGVKTDPFIAASGIERAKFYIFFEAVILARAVTRSCHHVNPVRAPPEEEFNDLVHLPRVHGLEKAGQCYLNKLAQLCSNTPDRGDISAIALLRDPETRAIFYLIGSNSRKESELHDTAQFIHSLFNTLNVEDSVIEREMGRIADELMRKTLLFHKRKIKTYLNGVTNEIQNCIQTDEDHPVTTHLRQIEASVERCKKLAFRVCDKSFLSDAGNEELLSIRQAYVSSIQDLFPKLEHFQRTIGFIHDKSRSGTQESTWSSLLHWTGRILSYASAPPILIATRQAWPEIFDPLIELVLIPSSTKMPNPFPPRRRQAGAADLINRVFSDPADREMCSQEAERRQTMGTRSLDALVKEEFEADSFRPFVHCEILLHDWIMRWAEGAIRPDMFYFNAPYIGVGKPTCRLCWTYLSNHPSGIGVRKSSSNIYPAWRMPDSYRAVNMDTESDRLWAIEKIKEDMRLLSKRTLADGRARRKERDTETLSSRPSVAGGFLAGVSVYGGAQRAPRLMTLDGIAATAQSEWRMGNANRESGSVDSGIGMARPPSSMANERISWGEHNVVDSFAKLSLDGGSSTSRISTNGSTGVMSGSTSGGDWSSFGGSTTARRIEAGSESSDFDSDEDGGGVLLFKGRGNKGVGRGVGE
ncbi:hypothetical protein V8F20_006412 [Naviculisporaceae sp. PSN 640]